MDTTQYAQIVTRELADTLALVPAESGERLADMILAAKKVFVAGAGRSGFAVKAFAMRLMHLGFSVYVCGETVTPNLEAGDLFLAASGSGETGSLVSMTRKAKDIGAAVATVTTNPGGTVGQLADAAVVIPAPSPKVETGNGLRTIQPMGSLFEQSCLLFLDCVILRLMEKRGDDTGHMYTRHANLE